VSDTERSSVRASALAVLVSLLAICGCSSGNGVQVRVTPASSRLDQPLHIRVTGLGRGETAVVRVRAEDARGLEWQSAANFRGDDRGELDLDHATPTHGAYNGAWGMGLLASLTTRSSVPVAFTSPKERSTTFHVDVLMGGKTAASTEFRRGLPKVEQQSLSVAQAGFFGRYYAPPPGKPRTAPVVIFGGSEGGLTFSRVPTLLAWRGHPTLSLAYFDEPGLPRTLSQIPLEYFARALRWLRARPEAGSRRVAVIGVSRGSEAAQLLGVHYPSLVGAVVAAVPSNSAICDLPRCTGSAWTFRGRPVLFTKQLDFTEPSDNPAAVIPVERIHGPLLLVCGGKDSVWRSCPYTRAILARRRRLGRSRHDAAYAYPRAGHFVGSLLPYGAAAPRWLAFKPADERAREDFWPRLLSFLARV
jgi:dienelactone hydrolase